jgi:hypothetical protein
VSLALAVAVLGTGCGSAGGSMPSAKDATPRADATASPGATAGSGAAQAIGTSRAETAARRLVAAQTGADVVSVSCPRVAAVEVGADFTCTATGGDRTTAAVAMTVQDAAGDVALRPLDLLQTVSAARLIADALTHEYKATVTVRCPDLVSAHKNTTMTCHATHAGVVHDVLVTVKDNQGSLAYRLEK